MIWAVLFWIGFAVVCMCYGGYGLWVAWLARVRPRRCCAEYLADDRLPAVTCVMAAANEAALIGRKLDIVRRQDYPADKLSIIVASDGSVDGTDEIVAARAAVDPRIQLFRAPSRSGKPTALNLARQHIGTEIAVLMDVRQDLTPRAVRELVAHLADPTVGVVSGNLRVKEDTYWAYETLVRRCESRSGSMVQVAGCLYAIRTRDFPVIPADTILDDVYVPLTVALTGRRIVMAEEATALDVAPRSVGHEFRRKVRTLAGLVQICHTVTDSLNPARNPLWGRFVAHKLGRLACPYGLVLMLLGSVMAPGLLYRLAFGLAVGLGLVAVWSGGVGRRLSAVSRAVLALNLAAFWAVPAYYLGLASVTWTRIEADRT
jgi:cellulose synthase/poly-beta-1,6-N-acetylglucosamine synthase-like glycosyltransferase